jgi:DNA-binding GntR family transcriptional regulator
MTGELPIRCSQRELVRRYDVQPAVVVKVLRDLAKFGVVQRQPGHGWSFLPTIDTPAAHDESYRLRIIVEPAAMLEPEFKLDPAWIEEMRKRHERFLNASWKEAMSIDYFHMNADFHVGLALASGNRYIASMVEQHNELRRFLNYNWTYGADRVKVSAHEHLEMLQVLERGDYELASLLMRRHLDEARLLAPSVATD